MSYQIEVTSSQPISIASCKHALYHQTRNVADVTNVLLHIAGQIAESGGTAIVAVAVREVTRMPLYTRAQNGIDAYTGRALFRMVQSGYRTHIDAERWYVADGLTLRECSVQECVENKRSARVAIDRVKESFYAR